MRIILTLIIALVLGACAPLVPIDTIGCESSPRKPVQINYQRNSSISVDKPNLEVTQGDVIMYNVVGDRTRKVEIVGDVNSGWLDDEIAPTSSGGNVRKGYACVDDEQDPDIPYTYKVVIDGVGELDPEVTVRRRNR